MPIPKDIAAKLFKCPKCGKTSFRSRTDKVYCSRNCKQLARLKRRAK